MLVCINSSLHLFSWSKPRRTEREALTQCMHLGGQQEILHHFWPRATRGSVKFRVIEVGWHRYNQVKRLGVLEARRNQAEYLESSEPVCKLLNLTVFKESDSYGDINNFANNWVGGIDLRPAMACFVLYMVLSCGCWASVSDKVTVNRCETLNLRPVEAVEVSVYREVAALLPRCLSQILRCRDAFKLQQTKSRQSCWISFVSEAVREKSTLQIHCQKLENTHPNWS